MAVHGTRARAALAQMTDVDPALAALALWCQHRDGDGATRTTGDTIIYGPDFDTLSRPEQVGMAAHHILHVALRHSPRAGAMAIRQGPGFSPALYALAADALINETLLLAGHALPRPVVRATELVRRATGDVDPAEAVLTRWDADALYLALTDASGGGGRSEAEAYAKEKSFAPDLTADGDTGGAVDEAASEWRGRVLQALETGRMAGTGIGAIHVTLGDLPQARIPWELHLRRRLNRALSHHAEPSYRRPAARWIAAEDAARRAGRPAPAFEPGRARAPHRLRLVVGVDTSSSVTDAQLGAFVAELGGIARRTGAETFVLGFDTEVHSETLLPDGRWQTVLPALVMRRDGGTAFPPVLARAADLKPSVAVMLTDLDGPLGADPGVPVLWATPGPPARPPDFGDVIEMHDQRL